MAEIIDFTKLMDILPENGSITITFMRQKDGTIAMVYAPRYDGLAKADAAVVNGDTPFWGTPEQLQSTVPGRIADIARESIEYIAVAGVKKPETAADRIRQARERKLKERTETDKAHHQETAGQTAAPRPAAKDNADTLTPTEMELIPNLPEKLAGVMHMRFVEGRTLQYIGDAIGKTKQTVNLRINKGRSLLIQLAETEGQHKPLPATIEQAATTETNAQRLPDEQHPPTAEPPDASTTKPARKRGRPPKKAQERQVN